MWRKGETAVLRRVYGETLAEIGKTHPEIVVLDADLSKSTMTALFAEKFPERFYDVGIAEQDMLGTAAGLANYGKTVFASSFAIFASGRAWEQIRNSICYPNLPVRIVATHAGVTVGPDGGSHQAVEDIAVMRVLPRMRVVVPADAIEVQAVVRYLAGHVDGPYYVRLGRDTAVTVHEPDYRFEPGRGIVLREGKDVALVACGILVAPALEAAAVLAAEGIEATVVNMSTIKPLDRALVDRLSRDCGAFVTCEEHSVIGGLAGAVAEALAAGLPAPLATVGMEDCFGESGEPAALLEKFGLTAARIVEKARAALARKHRATPGC